MTNDNFFERLLATFQIEAKEHLKAMSAGLLDLEKISDADEQKEIIETIFREAHSLKGAARAVNLTNVEAVCQSLESIFAVLKRQEIELSPALFDVLHQSLDIIESLLSSPEGQAEQEDHYDQVTTIIDELDHLAAGGETGVEPDKEAPPETPTKETPLQIQPPAASEEIDKPAAVTARKPEEAPASEPAKNVPEVSGGTGDKPAKFPSPPPKKTVTKTKPRPKFSKEKSGAPDTIRISAAKLDSLLLQIEEMLAVKLITGQRAVDLRGMKEAFDVWQKEWNKVRPEAQAIQRSLSKNGTASSLTEVNFQIDKLLAFLEWNYQHTKTVNGQLVELVKSVEQGQRSVGSMVDNLLEDMKKALMLPFSSLLEIFPKMVRDLSRAQNKEVELILQGAETEIDRRILDEIKDPLIHLIRNCVDHGLEAPHDRAKNNKPAQGTITISVLQVDASKVEITISDDGAGINVDRVKTAAIKEGIITGQEAGRLSNQESLLLIFRSALSTSAIITDLSGRGLGLAIVRERVEKLGGRVTVNSSPHKGTVFQIFLPVTLATFRGVLVETSGRQFVIPTTNVDRVLRFTPGQIKTVENRDVIPMNGQMVAIVPLAQVLKLPPPASKNGSDAETMPAMVLGAAEKKVAFIVEQILSEQEVLVKGLGKQLVRVRNVAGATILGSGKVVPILNVSDLLKSVAKISGSRARPLKPTDKRADETDSGSGKKSVLVVEDSITSRMLLKNVLEAAGYHVKTCVDGVDAFTTLRTEPFNLMVSDIEMPRMNGFDLTAKIRADEELSELPIVLVTSLGSREDRERGIDVGADAYIIKSSFDQTSLLEIVQRLII